MKRLFLVCIAIAFLFVQIAEAQIKFPSPAPVQTIKQEFGLGNIEVTYSRPGANERRVFGDLVPYDRLWRTGANATTKIVFSEPVEISGRKVDPGTYALFTIPGEESWEVIINKGFKNTGTEGYRESEDVVRFKVEPLKTKLKTECFTIQFADIKPESCALHLLWEKKLVVIPITTNVKEKIRAQINAAMLTDKKPYWQAAQFYYEYDHNFSRALDNVNKATESNPKSYWMYLYKAKIQKEMGDNTGALESSKLSMTLSKEAKNDDYIRMNEKLQKELKRN
ncbi:MAG: DUF2911 domain-containing protein [Ferruginibacter sp.]|nr:DUF2911 domain-containing protein [Ferruginibacter sp.]